MHNDVVANFVFAILGTEEHQICWPDLQRKLFYFIDENTEGFDKITVGEVQDILYERAILDERFEIVPAITLRFAVRAVVGQAHLIAQCDSIEEKESCMQILREDVNDVYHQIKRERAQFKR